MKKVLALFAGVGLFAVSQMALSSSDESYQMRCEEEAVEEKVEQDLLEDYMRDCISYYRDIAGEGVIESPGAGEDEEENSSSEQ